MIRRTLQSALCLLFCLAPLLVAQQVGQADASARGATPAEVLFAYRTSMNRGDFTDSILESPRIPGSLYGLSTVPFEAPIELSPVDPAAWANATTGSTLAFRVVDDVIVRRGAFNKSSYTDVNAGSLIDVEVIGMRKSSLRNRHGKAEPRVREVLVGNSIRLELECFPSGRARFGAFARNLLVWPAKGVSMVTLLPIEYLVLGIACSRGCDL